MGTKLLNTINLVIFFMQSQQWMSGAMDNSLSLHIEGLGCVSFLFLNIGSVLQHQFIRKYLNVTFDIKPKKV